MRKKIGKGKVLEELVKGSMDYTMNLIREAFRAQFPHRENEGSYYVNEVFSDHVIVSSWENSELKTDEYFKVTYSKNGDVYTFAARDAWEIVELTYQPQTSTPLSPSAETSPQIGERNLEGEKKKRGARFEERVDASITLEEAQEGVRRIKIEGAITAGVVNGNKRRYPANVIEAAVAELRNHLNESAGQGRAVQILGEAEHPSDKGGRPNLLETVTKWEEVSFVNGRVDITGRILETSKGKDILTLMEGGVMPGVSLRGYGDGKKNNGIFEVNELHITGFDLVLEPSFENAAQLIESIQPGDIEMNLEQLLQLMRENPEAFAGITEAQLKKMGAEQLKAIEENVRTALGIGAGENITESLKALKDKAGKFEEGQKRSEVEAAIKEATKDLPFGKELNEAFIESIKEAELASADAVKKFAESKRKEYGKLAAKGALKGMGFDEKKGIVVLGDVLERETGTPSFAKAAFDITESVRKSENRAKTALVQRAESPAAVFTEKVLEKFDQTFQRQLVKESREFNEAEAASDLNLPYSVMRAVIAEAYPNLVAANVFDVGIMDGSPTNIFFEAFVGETGYEVAVTDEVETGGAEDTWYELANKNIVPGTVTITSNPAGTTYAEGTDYILDYELGKIYFLAAGSIGANDILASYTYHASRKGEGAEIERGKMTLDSQVVTAIAYRLAAQINNEAIVFSRSQLGYDAVTRTIASLIEQVRMDIDRALIEKGVMAALSVASNIAGTWDISDAVYADFVKLIGIAKVKVANRHYKPTSVLMSNTSSDLLSNWDGFKTDGFPNALLNAAGFSGSVKGLPVFASSEMRDTWNLVSNRQLVMHRVLQPMLVKGPYPTYGENRELIAAEQYYVEEYNGSIAPIGGKGSIVKTQA